MTATDPVDQGLETVQSAQRRLLSSLTPLPSESVALDVACGRFLAEVVVTTAEHPAFDNSAMDGYAVRAADIVAATRDQPVAVPVIAEARAGEQPAALPEHTAIRIMTGAPLPPGADTVVRQEDTSRSGETVVVEVAVEEGTHVRRRGSDMGVGTAVLAPGRALTGVDIGVAAALGRFHLLVGRRPRVAVLAGGDELVVPGVEADFAQVVDFNSPMLMAAIQAAGGEAVFLGIARDTPDAIRGLLENAKDCDVIISSAGVSGDLPVATTSGAQGSSILHSLAAADCLLVLTAEAALTEGGVVEAIPLR